MHGWMESLISYVHPKTTAKEKNRNPLLTTASYLERDCQVWQNPFSQNHFNLLLPKNRTATVDSCTPSPTHCVSHLQHLHTSVTTDFSHARPQTRSLTSPGHRHPGARGPKRDRPTLAGGKNGGRRRGAASRTEMGEWVGGGRNRAFCVISPTSRRRRRRAVARRARSTRDRRPEGTRVWWRGEGKAGGARDRSGVGGGERSTTRPPRSHPDTDSRWPRPGSSGDLRKEMTPRPLCGVWRRAASERRWTPASVCAVRLRLFLQRSPPPPAAVLTSCTAAARPTTADPTPPTSLHRAGGG